MVKSDSKQPRVKRPRRWHFPQPEMQMLANGMQVFLNHRPGQYVAAVSLVLDIPLTVEQPELEGLATITQRCLDEGTRTHPGSSFAEALEGIGAALSGGVGYSATELFGDVPISRLPALLALLAEAVTEPLFAPTDVQRHVRERLVEIKQVLANSAPRAQLNFRAATIAAKHRASRMAGGTAATVANITPAAVADFHSRHYVPDGAILIISGDLSGLSTSVVADAFGPWTGAPASVPPQENLTARTGELWLVDRPGAVQADIRLGAFGIDRGDPRWADIQVATYAVGGAFLSRLNRVLREERGYTYGAHLVNTAMRDGGLLAMQGSFRTEYVTQALDQTRRILDLANAPLTQAEVTAAVDFAHGVAPLRYSTAQGVTDRIATLIADGVNPDFVNTNATALDLVTPESATQALAELLAPDLQNLVIVGDAAALLDPLHAAGWPVVVQSQ